MTINEIHNRFFSFRNGIVAKAFSDAGSGYKRVFGLQLPQIGAIAREAGGTDSGLADALWEEKECRESRLLACYLYDVAEIDKDKALELARSVRTREEADILAWRLLGKLPFAADLPPLLDGYIADALRRNLEK